MLIVHKIALDPNNVQATYFARAAGTARAACNWALTEWQRQYEAGKADASLPKPSPMALRRQLNTVKGEQFPWMLEVTVATLSTGEAIAGPKAHKILLCRLQRLSRGLSRKIKGSANRKIALSMDAKEWLKAVETIEAVRFVPVDNEISVKSLAFPGEFHKDLADRIIVATARKFAAPLLSVDDKIRAYAHIRTIW